MSEAPDRHPIHAADPSQRRHFGKASRKQIAPVELMVDGDVAPISHIQEAIANLRCEHPRIRTMVFAAPRRMENAKWRQFVASEPDMHFKAVSREGVRGQPTDEAMLSQVESVRQNRRTGYIAVLSSDSNLVKEIIRLAMECSMRVIVFGPSFAAYAEEQFIAMGAQVRHLHQRNIPFKVRGVLRTDGTGEYELVDSPLLSAGENLQRTKYLLGFLKSLGWLSESDTDLEVRLPQTLVKFWFHHFRTDPVSSHGSMTVFPIEQLIWTMHDIVRTGGSSWQQRQSEYAYCTPLVRVSRLSKENEAKYGGIRQKRLFLGGGPIILDDSDQVPEKMLTILGYLDHYNTDVREAAFVFVNVSDNKYNLRQLGMLSGSSFQMSQLRSAFLADLTCQWHRAPVDTFVRKLLVEKGCMRSEQADKRKVWKAMRAYARRTRLPGPELQTYNGLVWRIHRGLFADKDPSTRSVVEVHSDIGSS